jgi:uncharacterized spore protein YtfJ
MKIEDLLAHATKPFRATMVYAEPVERDGATVIPAARVLGGGGGGNGEDKHGQRGEGAGLGLVARPVGAFVIKDGKVRWQPAIDVNRLVTILGAIAVAGLWTGRGLHRRRSTE